MCSCGVYSVIFEATRRAVLMRLEISVRGPERNAVGLGSAAVALCESFVAWLGMPSQNFQVSEINQHSHARLPPSRLRLQRTLPTV